MNLYLLLDLSLQYAIITHIQILLCYHFNYRVGLLWISECFVLFYSSLLGLHRCLWDQYCGCFWPLVCFLLLYIRRYSIVYLQ